MYRKLQNDPNFIRQTFANHHHVLFDCDGLILDTEPIYSHVALQTIRHFLCISNHEHNDHDALFPLSLKLKVMGGDKFQVAKFMAEHLNTRYSLNVTAEDWCRNTEPLETAQFTLCKLMPAVTELVNVLVRKGWPIAVATSSSRHSFAIKSQAHAALFASFPVITCGDDLDYSPSLPSISESESSQQRVQGIVLEDSPNGVVAALRSGHSCIWVPAESVQDGFGLVDEVLSRFPNEVDSNLFVYRAKSLQDVLDIINAD